VVSVQLKFTYFKLLEEIFGLLLTTDLSHN